MLQVNILLHSLQAEGRIWWDDRLLRQEALPYTESGSGCGMRWAKTTLRNSFFGWLAHQPEAEPSERLEDIRKAMLELLEQSPDGANSAIERRVLFARNLDDLWYLRPDLMTAIAAERGEFVARSCLADITSLFDAGTGGKPRQSSTRTPPVRR